MNNTFYESPNDYRSYLSHHGVKGQKWGVRKQYPIIGRARRGQAYKFSSNLLISSLQDANQRRNKNRHNKETKIFNNRNPKLKERLDRASEEHYNYIENAIRSYGKNKKLTSGINKLIESRVSFYEKQSGKSGKEYKQSIVRGLTNPHNDDRDDATYDLVQDYLSSNDKEYQRLNAEYNNARHEYDSEREKYGRY